jgi:uncharacterized protein YigA (DUF484 family)
VGDDKQSLTARQVKDYLAEHPDFFLQEPEAIDFLQLGHSPEGTISLVQRQVERLQQKNQQLHEQLRILIENARTNTALQARIHRLCLRLMDAPSFGTLLPMLMTELKQEFNADEVALRWFYAGDKAPLLPDTDENIVQQHADADDLRVFDKLLSRQEPVCGRLSNAQNEFLFPQKADKVKSVACLPMGHEPCAGILAIASYDEERFHADMATDYLSFLGEVTMRLLRPYG